MDPSGMPDEPGEQARGGTGPYDPGFIDDLKLQVEKGTLYLVSTPIGHRADLSPRALAVIGAVDTVAAEDTRHTGTFLASLGAGRPLVSYHEHNKKQASARLIEELESGRSVALVSDAGTPGLSDPGYILVRAAVKAGIPVVSIPGPTAVVAALVVSGLPTDSFTFTGFLPAKKGKRQKVLGELAGLPHTLVFYESPHRIASTLADMASIFGDRPAAVCREMTKKFEEVRRGVLSELAQFYETSDPRGEFTVVVAGKAFKYL